MKLAIKRARPHRQGFTLVECLVYMTVLFLICEVALNTFAVFTNQARDFRRNAADIVRVTDAGERWRRELRLATDVEPLPIGTAGIRLQTKAGEVRYVLDGGTVWREIDGIPGRQAFLQGVRRSEFMTDVRRSLVAWRWEVELQSPKSTARIRPLFSFTAVMDKDFKP